MQPQVKVIPYLMYQGNCEEALEFYKEAIGGELTIVNRYDNPAMNAPADYQNKILHARLEFQGGAIYASDVFPGQAVKKTSGDVSITLIFNEDLEKTKTVFNRMCEGGTLGMPFEKQFWGDWHGSLTDKYGFNWNINFEEEQHQ